MIREALSAVARNESLGEIMRRTPVAREVVKRVVGGDTADEALAVAQRLADAGFWASLERAAPAASSAPAAVALLDEYRALADQVVASGLADVCELAVLPEALGTADGLVSDAALARLDELCAHAGGLGVAVTVGMGPETDVARTLDWAAERLTSGQRLGITLQATLRRTEADCERFSGHRVRLVKGMHRTGGPAAHTEPIEVGKAYVRCAKVLLRGDGTPSFATHDPRLIRIVDDIATTLQRDPLSFEHAFYFGRLEREQDRLAEAGHRVRVYVPYGPDWFERLVGGLAEQPSSVAAAVWSLLPG